MKYENVKVVAKIPCSCEGRGAPCDACHGTGEREQALLNPGEPFFLVRAQDRLGPLTVALYALLLGDAGGTTDGLDELSRRMVDFQAANPGLVKLPD